MLQQATKEKYGIETLKERNVSYDHEHGLTQKDVDMANNHVQTSSSGHALKSHRKSATGWYM